MVAAETGLAYRVNKSSTARPRRNAGTSLLSAISIATLRRVSLLSEIPDTSLAWRVLSGTFPRCNGHMVERITGAAGTRTVELGATPLSPDDVAAVARGHATVVLDDTAKQNLSRARRHIEALAEATEPTYGVSTGFGALAVRHIPPERRTDLQRSLIRSHAAGAGEPVESEVVRALMFLRLRTLSTGHTGVRPETAHTLAQLLNANITPVVPEHGSLGCSGDLAPLAAVALALMGEGEVF